MLLLMFKRASDDSNQDEFIDIGERLAPYGAADRRPELADPGALSVPGHPVARDVAAQLG